MLWPAIEKGFSKRRQLLGHWYIFFSHFIFFQVLLTRILDNVELLTTTTRRRQRGKREKSGGSRCIASQAQGMFFSSLVFIYSTNYYLQVTTSRLPQKARVYRTSTRFRPTTTLYPTTALTPLPLAVYTNNGHHKPAVYPKRRPFTRPAPVFDQPPPFTLSTARFRPSTSCLIVH